MPNLLLQPLVENAIQHGISRIPNEGRLRISAFLRNEKLSIFVANSGSFLSSDPLRGPGVASAAAASRQGIGLTNTRARLHALYGDDQSFELPDWHEGGVEDAISIPAQPVPPDECPGWKPNEGETFSYESAYRR